MSQIDPLGMLGRTISVTLVDDSLQPQAGKLRIQEMVMPTITGTTGDDSLTGTEQDDVITGAGGYDSINGRGGNDRIVGNGVLSGGDGDDLLVLTQPNSANPGSVTSGGAGYDTLDLTSVQLSSNLSGYYFVTATVRADGEAMIGEFQTYDSRGRPGVIHPVFRADGIERLIGYNLPNYEYPVTVGSPGMNLDLTGRTTSIEVIGGQLSDTLRGGSAADILRGGGNADLLILGAGDQGFGDDGNDTLQFFTRDYLGLSAHGGEGTDALTISMVNAFEGLSLVPSADPRVTVSGIENITLIQELAYSAPILVTTIVGDAGDNLLRFIRAANATPLTTGITFRGGGGNDTITSVGTNDFLYGDEGSDTITGSGRLDGGSGNDVLTGSGELFGGDGNDTLNGSGTLSGGAGDDRITATVTTRLVGGGAQVFLSDSRIDGGSGLDTLDLGSTYAGFEINLAEGVVRGGSLAGSGPTVGQWAISGIENAIGGQRDDLIIGDAGANQLSGGLGQDTIRGGAGDDLIRGYGLAINLGNDGGDALYGEGGNDRIYGEYGNDYLDGGDGDDWLDGGDMNDVLEGGAGADTLIGGAGSDRLSGGTGDDLLIGGAGLDVFDGGEGFDTVVFDFSAESAGFLYENGQIVVTGPEGRETLTGIERLRFSNAEFDVGADGRVVIQSLNDRIGTAGADLLIGTSGRDNILGQDGDDVLIGGDNWDMLNGGAGIDTAGYSGLIRAYTVGRTSGAFSTVSGGPETGTDNLTSIERLGFLDGILDTNPNGAAAQIYRLYDAALDRSPDQAGLAGWVVRLETGTTLSQAAQAFATAPEFVARYGNLSNEDFVKTMYRFSLNREGDAFGISQWKSQLDTGVSRGSILQSFSESVEHRNLTAAAVSTGLFVQDDRTIAVARLYDAAFDRVPDQGGLAYWRGTLEAGGSLFAIANAFVSSQEFQDRYGALSNSQFIDQLYRFTLNREADDFGRHVWVDRLNGGTTRAEMVVIFSESVEHMNLTAPTWQDGIRYENYVGPSSAVAEALLIKDMDAFVLPAQPHDAAYDTGLVESGLDTSLADILHAPMIDQHIIVDVWTNSLELATLPSGDDLVVGHRHFDWM